jgi:hypothetical protein
MKIRWGKKTYIFGAKAKAEYRAHVHRQAREFVRIAKAAKDASDNPIDLGKEFLRFFAVFNVESSPLVAKMSARERIITVTSLLDEELRWCITLKMSASRGSFPSRSVMDSIFEGTTTLASFGDKISFCSVFGLIPNEIKGDLNVLKDIRNRFAAHTFTPLTFDDPELAARCLNLQRKLEFKESSFDNEYERRFMQSAWMIIITLLFVSYMLVEQQKVVNENADAIVRNAIAKWNDIFEKAGWPKVEVPQRPPSL